MSAEKEAWNGGVADLCTHFQMDLSCLVDGELDEAAASRAMLHLEECEACREFFDDTRNCMRLHLDVADPDRLIARISALMGGDLAASAAGDPVRELELVHRLATIFYQLGKAYLLAALDPDHHTRVFERAVAVEAAQTQGRGFVDGVLLGGAGDSSARPPQGPGGIDWENARHLLNGRLKKIQSPLEKARKLLKEAIDADPSHDEARLYIAFLHAREGKRMKAAQEYREVFDTATSDQNRGHAAVQLGLLYDQEEEFRKALACFRWVTISGLAERDPRFFFARFNIGLEYALLGDDERSLGAFRTLLDLHPDRAPEVASLFLGSKNLRRAIDARPPFAQALLTACPELFSGEPGPGEPSS
jgi:tetratricopeptide (TPR) repeat protein